MKPLPPLEVLHLNLVYEPFSGELKWRQSGEFFGKVRKNGYISGYFDGENYLAHRLIYRMMTGEQPEIIDHDNGTRSDNRWSNLGNVSLLKNNQNHCVMSTNTSGFTGVRKVRGGKYEARICTNGTRIILGYFVDIKDAIAARQAANVYYKFHERHGKRYSL